MTIRKWNYEKQDYEPFEIPDSWHCPMISFNMNEIVNCVSCGKKISFGDCYTSRIYHGKAGMGYNVCPKCHEKEMREDIRTRERRFEP